MDVAFYQLLKTPLERALPKLLEKVYQSGFRVLVVCEDDHKMETLNTVLWTFSTAAFLPHGNQGDPKRQPIWLSLEPRNVNDSSIVVVTNGAMIDNNPEKPYTKCLDIFDGNDVDKTKEARQRYLHYKKQGCSMTYWKQNSEGGWDKEV